MSDSKYLAPNKKSMSKIFEAKEEQLLENEVESTVPPLSPEDIETLKRDHVQEDVDQEIKDLQEDYYQGE